MYKQSVVVSLLLLIVVMSTEVKGERWRKVVGGRSEIKDLKTNKEVQELGRFSVKEYNKMGLGLGPNSSSSPLIFLEVVEAQRQVVAGLKYYLKVAAMKDGLSTTFDAVVVVKPWLNSKQLLHFGPKEK